MEKRREGNGDKLKEGEGREGKVRGGENNENVPCINVMICRTNDARHICYSCRIYI